MTDWSGPIVEIDLGWADGLTGYLASTQRTKGRLHIPRQGGCWDTDREGVPYLEALCGHRLYRPDLHSYWAWTPEERADREVCGHCARRARRLAVVLLAHAAGRG